MTGADSTGDVGRRGFLRAAGTAAAGGAAAAAAPAAAQEGIDYGGWFDDVPNFDGTTDATGQSEVTVDVGADNGEGQAFAFAPPAVQVDPGTTVVWEWTGEGGAHNVVQEGGDRFGAPELVAEPGATYEYTFEEAGIYRYYCEPHRGLGMKGAVVVGQPDQGGEEGGGGPLVPNAARSLTVATLVGMLATLGLAFFFIKYGESTEPEA